MPPEKVHEKLFVGSMRKFRKPSNPAVARYNKEHTQEEVDKMTDKLIRKEKKLRKRLAAHGIEYDFPGFVRTCGFSMLVLTMIHAFCLHLLLSLNIDIIFPPRLHRRGHQMR